MILGILYATMRVWASCPWGASLSTIRFNYQPFRTWPSIVFLHKVGRLLLVKRPLVLQPLPISGHALDFLAVKVGHCKGSATIRIQNRRGSMEGVVPGLPALELEGSTRFFLTRAKNSTSFWIIWAL